MELYVGLDVSLSQTELHAHHRAAFVGWAAPTPPMAGPNYTETLVAWFHHARSE